MKAPELATQRLVLDPAAAGDLRNRLRTDPQAGVRQAARQFEGMLLHLMLKSMRDAMPTSGVLDSEQSVRACQPPASSMAVRRHTPAVPLKLKKKPEANLACCSTAK